MLQYLTTFIDTVCRSIFEYVVASIAEGVTGNIEMTQILRVVSISNISNISSNVSKIPTFQGHMLLFTVELIFSNIKLMQSRKTKFVLARYYVPIIEELIDAMSL